MLNSRRRPGLLTMLFLVAALVSPSALAASTDQLTTTRIDVSERRTQFGQPVTFTVTVSTSTGVVPTGTVTFTDNGIVLGTVTLNLGTATLVLSGLDLGTHKVAATFAPLGPFDASDDRVVILVRRVSTEIALTANPSPSMFGQPVTFTATVSSPAGVPTGSVRFIIDGTSAGTAVVDANGLATFVTSTLLPGDHEVTAHFIATDPFRSSRAMLIQTVTARSERIIVAATDAAPGHVKVFDADTQSLLFSFLPYPGFTGGVTVAVGDVDADSVPDVLTANSGADFAPHIRVFSGADLAELHSFLPFADARVEVFLAAGDVNGDGRDDIIVGAGLNSHVKVFDGASGAELRSFFAFPGFSGGVTVASGDVNNDGVADIITGTATGTAHVKAFHGVTLAELRSFFAYPPTFTGGVFVAAGDINNDGFDDIITGAGAGAPHVKAFDSVTNAEVASFLAYSGFTGGVRVAALDFDQDGFADFATAPAAGTIPHIKVFDSTSLAELASFLAFDVGVGIHIAAGR